MYIVLEHFKLDKCEIQVIQNFWYKIDQKSRLSSFLKKIISENSNKKKLRNYKTSLT